MARDNSVAENTVFAMDEVVDSRDFEQEDNLLEVLPVAVCVYDKEGLIKKFNKKAAELWGRKPQIGDNSDQFCGALKLSFPTGQVLSHDENPVIDCLHTGNAIKNYELIIGRPDGSGIRVISNTEPLKNNFGEVTGAINCFYEVPAKENLHNSTSESEFRYRELLKKLPIAIYTTNTEGYITFFNEAAVKLWGRVPEVNKEKWSGAYKMYNADGSGLLSDDCPMATTLKERSSVNDTELIIERPDGSKRFVLPSPAPVFDAAGSFIGGVNMLMDVTDLKDIEYALRESEERFKMAANAAPVLIWMSDIAGSRYFFNKGWLEFTGRTLEQERGHGWIESLHPADKDYVLKTFDVKFAEEKDYKLEYRLRRHDGQYRWVLSQGRPRFTGDGVFEGYIGTIIDNHEQKILKEQLEKSVEARTTELTIANEKLEQSNKELEQFAYVASHDLQEPLRKIKAFGDILANKYKEELAGDGANLIERMQSASERMKTLIDGLLNYSRASSIAQLEEVDIAAELKEVLIDLDDAIKEKHAIIHIGNFSPVQGNATQIRQLFQNLLSNAIKFSKPDVTPEIFISSREVQGTEIDMPIPPNLDKDDRFQLIEIKDNGIGFEQEYAQKIFQVFQRLHGRKEYSGSGIGLSIVQKVMDNHNGFVTAIGNPGEGAVFQLLFPL